MKEIAKRFFFYMALMLGFALFTTAMVTLVTLTDPLVTFIIIPAIAVAVEYYAKNKYKTPEKT